MRIGFDARWFYSGNPSGQRVIHNLLRQLVIQASEHEFIVFLPWRDRHREFPFRAPHVRPLYVGGGNGLFTNLVGVPWKARHEKIDVAIFQYFAPPWGHYSRIAFINDIIFETNPDYFTMKERLYFSPMRFLARQADGICTISQSEKRRLLTYGYGTEERIFVLYIGIDNRFVPRTFYDEEKLFSVKRRYGLPDRYILYVGRLTARKNLVNLLRAVSLIKDDSVNLVLVGKSDSKKLPLSETIRDLHLGHRVLLPGFVPDQDLPLIYALASVFCYISFDEGFGLPCLEAMASGVPVVTARKGALPEILGESAMYVDETDPRAISAALEDVLKRPEIYAAKVTQGIARAQSFTWERAAKELLDVCLRVRRRKPVFHKKDQAI